MKIIHVIRGKADPDTMNGVNRIVHSLATEQVAMGRDVEVWGITSSPEDLHHQHEYPIRLFQAFGLRMGLPQPLQGAVAELAVDDTIVHFHSVFVLEYFALARALERRGIQWVQSPHGGYAPEAWRRNRWRKRLYFALFEQNLVRGAAAAQATGKGELNDVAALAPRLASFLIPNGQEMLERATVARPEGAEIRFGYCGRLATRQKALDLMLEGFALYRRQGGKGTLHLVGDGPDRSNLEQLAKSLGIEELVTFAGPAFGADKIAQLCQFDVLVHSSRWEGLAMMLLEASALGIPVIVSEETNFGDYVRQFGCGIVLETNDGAGIASALHQATEMRETGDLERAGANGRQMIAGTFSWRAVAQRIETELYGRPPRDRRIRDDRSLLVSLFEDLERSGLAYVVVGDTRLFPGEVTGDVDLIFSQDRMEEATRFVRSFARRHGLQLSQVLRHEYNAYYICLTWYDGAQIRTMKLDYCGDYLRQGRRLMSSDEVLEGRIRQTYDDGERGFHVPSTGTAFLYYLMKRLDKNQVEGRATSYLAELWEQDPAACEAAFLSIWTSAHLPDLRQLLQPAPGDLISIQRLRAKLHAARRFQFGDWLRELNRKRTRLLQPTGLMVAIIGPDGVGKSAVIGQLVARASTLFRSQRHEHLRPGLLPRLDGARVTTDPHGRPPYASAKSAAKAFYLLVDYVVGYWGRLRVILARSTLVMFDRYYYDLVADPLRWRYGGPKWLPRALLPLVPKPDLTILLDAEPSTILARKQELGEHACRVMVGSYRDLATTESLAVVDANRPIDAVVQDAHQLLIDRMTRRVRRQYG